MVRAGYDFTHLGYNSNQDREGGTPALCAYTLVGTLCNARDGNDGKPDGTEHDPGASQMLLLHFNHTKAWENKHNC